MASLPPQHPASQRRPSPPATESSPSSSSSPSIQPATHAPRTSSFGAASVDSQTLLLNSPRAQSPKAAAAAAAEAASDAPSTAAPQPQEDDEPRRCWICFNDETEDDATSSEWRSPCPCALVAHEKCLLDWIADMEAPSSRRRTGGRTGKILCPQCKTEIKMQRPTSMVVEGVRAIDRFTGSLLLPGFAFATGTALYSTLAFAGTHTIYTIFGTQDAMQILGPLYQAPDPGVQSLALRLAAHVQQHWRLDIGLPLIPAVLVASRTTLADSFLPFLPLIFFVSSGQPGDEMLRLQWPPSAAFAFAALPYIRGAYNAYYERVWAAREKQWLKEIQPRAGTDDAEAEPAAEHDHVHAGDRVVEIEVDFDMFGDWNNGGAADDHDHDHDHDDQLPAAPRLPQDDEPALLADLAADAAPAPNVPAQPRRQRDRREGNVAFSTTSLADTILGALIFPSIAAAMGELLAHTLPYAWVTPTNGRATSWLGGWAGLSRGGRPTGFLQTRWGRSLVGGCLFVGLKDAVLLYVRWKIAQNHRRRRVLDCDRGTGRGRGGTQADAGADRPGWRWNWG